MAKELKCDKGLYTAFNKAIVEESSKRFDKNVEAKTLHSLAYKYVKPDNIDNFGYSDIEEKLSYPDKTKIINILDGFYRSEYTDIEKYFDTLEVNDKIKNLVNKYYILMMEEKIPATFNFLLKKFHMMLKADIFNIDYDLLILDECQDTTAVTLEIFKLLNAKKKIMLGDKYQNIYDFMDTVNAFEILTNTEDFRLTQSFRCSPKIAVEVEEFGKKYLDNNFKFKGTEYIKDTGTVAHLSA